MTINPDSTDTGMVLKLGQVRAIGNIMVKPRPDKQQPSLYERYNRLSTSKKVILLVFLIWFIQAVPKWTAAILADDEMSATIMKVFVTPRYEK